MLYPHKIVSTEFKFAILYLYLYSNMCRYDDFFHLCFSYYIDYKPSQNVHIIIVYFLFYLYCYLAVKCNNL